MSDVMDTIKKLFGDEPIDYDAFMKGIQKEEIKLANLSTGDYVNKEKFLAVETKSNELEAQLEKRDQDIEKIKGEVGDNEALNLKITELQESNKSITEETDKKLAGLKIESAIELSIASARPIDSNAQKSIMGLIDRDIVKLNEKGELAGMSEQLEKLKKGSPYFFESEKELPKNTDGANPADNGDDEDEFDFENATTEEVYDHRLPKNEGK